MSSTIKLHTLNSLENKEKRERVVREFARVINCHSLENGSDTPDWQLAEYLVTCLEGYNKITQIREKYYGRVPEPTPLEDCPQEFIPTVFDQLPAGAIDAIITAHESRS